MVILHGHHLVPDRGRSARLSKSRIQEVLVTLQEYQEETPFTFKITGTLTAVHLRRKTFENGNYRRRTL